MSLSRNNQSHQTSTQPDAAYQPPVTRYWIGRDKAKIEYVVEPELHWYQKHLMGYKATKWEKPDIDKDDGRYDLREKEV